MSGVWEFLAWVESSIGDQDISQYQQITQAFIPIEKTPHIKIPILHRITFWKKTLKLLHWVSRSLSEKISMIISLHEWDHYQPIHKCDYLTKNICIKFIYNLRFCYSLFRKPYWWISFFNLIENCWDSTLWCYSPKVFSTNKKNISGCQQLILSKWIIFYIRICE